MTTSEVDEFAEDVHVFGHTHLTVDMVLDGQRYVQWALGTPREQAAMSRAVADSGMLILCLGSGRRPLHGSIHCIIIQPGHLDDFGMVK